MSEKISVIIPVYNCAKYLRECIDSVLDQSYPVLEIVLINDGSTDGSGQICDEYAADISDKYSASDTGVSISRTIKVLHKENEGACYARRDGIRIATSDYLMFVDSDDWIESNMITELAGVLFESGADIITSGLIRDSGINTYDRIDEGLYEGDGVENIRKSVIFRKDINDTGILMSLCGKLFRKSLLKGHMDQLPSGICLWEDLTYCFIPFYYAQKIIVTHRAFYHYRTNEDSISHADHENEYEKMVFSLTAARNNYGRFGKEAAENIDSIVSVIFISYIMKLIEEQLSNTKELVMQLDKISRDLRFREPAESARHILRDKYYRRMLRNLLNFEYTQAINTYKIYRLRKAFFSLKIVKCIQGTKVYEEAKKSWRRITGNAE